MATKKLRLDTFTQKPGQALAYANRQGAEVIIVGDHGPVARIVPLAAPPRPLRLAVINPAPEHDTTPEMDKGGVWKLSPVARRRIERRSLWGQLSLGGIFNAARVSVILPILAKLS